MKTRPEHIAFTLVAFAFLMAGVAVLVEAKNKRTDVVNFTLCPLCGQEVRP